MSNNSNSNIHKTQGQTTLMYNLGKMRNTIASTSRKHKFCSKNSNSSEAIICTFNIGSQTNQTEIILKPPIILSIIDGNGSATITFTNEKPFINSIIDYLYSLDGKNYVSAGQTTSPIIVNGLQNGISYNITLKAVYQKGLSPSSNSISVIPSTIPEPPKILTSIEGDGEINIDFIKGFNGGSPIIDYLYSIDGINYISMGNISAPIKLTGLTNGKIYNITLKSVNKNGESDSSLSISLMPSGLPYPPQITNSIAGNGEATINFIDGFNNGTTIIGYLYSIDDLNYISSGSNSNPLRITELINGTTYNITLKSINKNGISSPSNSISVTPNNVGPLAPILTGVSFKTTDSMILTFTQQQNEFAITNYKYSLNGGEYITLSPVKTTSPITINGLSVGTNYNIKLRAISSSGDGKESNILNESTYKNVNYKAFTEVGENSWTVPQDVTFVQYLIVGGGGGGGATYSKINVLGDVLVTNTPQVGKYWINNVHLTNGRYKGRLYFGNNSGQNSSSFPDPVQLTAIIGPSDPNPFPTDANATYPYNKWYNTEIVYDLRGGLATTTNYFSPYVINSSRCNNVSGGSGGGSGGQVKFITGTNKYDVIPGKTYSIIVGEGGAGGIGGTNLENKGSPGGDSSFDTIISLGGSGGSVSRTFQNNQDLNKNGKGGQGGQSIGSLVGGSGGNSALNSNYGLFNSGSNGASGSSINFDGNGAVFYGRSGNGGKPNTVATGTIVENVGKGGDGTGATLNSFANGISGGSGIVILKYYT